jgi:hypothetical protein
MPRSRALRIVLAVGGAAAIAAAAFTSSPVFLPVAVLCLLFLATTLGHVARLAESLRGFEGRLVVVLVWGAPLLGEANAALRLEAVKAVGAGLLIYLSGSKAPRTLLKVAQPRAWRFEDARLIVEQAAYVQWDGRRLPRADGVPAVSLGTAPSGAA